MADVRTEAGRLYRDALAGRLPVRDATAMAHLLRVVVETLKAETVQQDIVVIQNPRSFE
ncbi:hypothetical protein [Tepidimonas alkaliphilus]|nr:hypothetical protein [Tepidimonas alkaliphilus]